MHKIDTFVLGAYQVNTYLLWEDNHVLIVDPGSKALRLQKMIMEANAIVDGIILTHGHCDHIGGVDALASLYKCDVYINEDDYQLLSDPFLNVSFDNELIIKTKVKAIAPGNHQIKAFNFEFIQASGHTEGSSMILWHDNLICGDVLFRGSIGRCDLPTGSNSKMYQSLQMIKNMDPSLNVYPGHGPSTTLLEELKYNPYLQ